MKKVIILLEIMLLAFLAVSCATDNADTSAEVIVPSVDVSVQTDSLYEEFWNLLNSEQYQEAEAVLKEWESIDISDPELYTSYFNFYLSQASNEQMHIEPTLPAGFNGRYMEGQNENGDYIYIYSIVEYDDELSAKAFEKLDEGISYNPKRLDMYFGKAHFYYLRGEYQKELEAIRQVIELNSQYKDAWLWTENEPASAYGVDIEMGIHEYITQWFQLDTDESFECAREISVLFTEISPDNPIFYNDAAVAYVRQGDLMTAKNYFKAGYECDPTDEVLLQNLIYVCNQLGELEEAEFYSESLGR